MSYVTNVMVSISILERRSRDELVNHSFQGQQFKCLTDDWVAQAWGGSKVVEATIYGAAFNYIGRDEILHAVEAIEWDYPEEVQIFIKGEDDDIFSVYAYDGWRFTLPGRDEAGQPEG